MNVFQHIKVKNFQNKFQKFVNTIILMYTFEIMFYVFLLLITILKHWLHNKENDFVYSSFIGLILIFKVHYKEFANK
jgi:hypothetical protein